MALASFVVAICMAGSAPAQVVSLNLCTDDLLVWLAPERVTALTPLARDPAVSVVADRAASLPWVRPAAEAVMALRPSLILAAPYGARSALTFLAARGYDIWTTTLPTDFDGIRAETRRLAARLGVPARGEAAVADMDAVLAGIVPAEGRALVWEPQGWSAGPGGLWNAVLRAAGLANAGDGSVWGLERVLRDRPDMLIVPTPSRFPALGTALLTNPAVAGIARRAVPPALTICPGPWTAEAARLAAGG